MERFERRQRRGRAKEVTPVPISEEADKKDDDKINRRHPSYR